MANLDHIYGLDERYHLFEEHNEGILVSLAGPGTGKTFSILKRVAALINIQQVDVESICYITFIKEIAKAFDSDYADEFHISDDFNGVPKISTLHSLACRLLRNRGFTIGYDGELFFTSIANKPDSFESSIFLTDLINILCHQSLNTIVKVRNSLLRVKQAWRENDDLDQLSRLDGISHSGYLDLAQAYRLIDWDHTIPLAYSLYQNPDNRQSWLTKIQHLLIDEYQDFNRSEQLFISSMISFVASAVIVGDDDQSLFSGRGGSPDGLRELYVSEDADQISLIRCHRCRSNILEHANKFLVTMKPNPRQMIPFHDGGLVESLRFKSSKAEVEFLSEFLNNCVSALPDEPKSRDGVICLFPTLVSLRYYFEKLSDQVPCYTTRHESDITRDRLTHALFLCARPGQRFSERLLLEYFTEIKARHKRLLVDLVVKNNISPLEACQQMVAEGEFTGNALESAKQYINFCQALSSRDLYTIVEHIESWTEIDSEELTPLLDKFIVSLDDENQEDAISNFCDVALPTTAHPAEDLKGVLFLTMHGSKGLTKHTVVMPGLEDAWLPGTAEGANLEERRRLFYVALTRATDHVLITHPATRARGDPMNYGTPGRSRVSRFVGESGIVTRYRK